jgi:hypothetical protein
MAISMTYIIHALAGVGAIIVYRWAKERWRTRKDKGYDSSKYGAL